LKKPKGLSFTHTENKVVSTHFIIRWTNLAGKPKS